MTDPFKDRARDMGLDISMANKGLYKYNDRYSEVIYRQFITGQDNLPHVTDALELPYLGVFIRRQDSEDFKYCGSISNYYKFIGNDVLNQSVRDSIIAINEPIFEEQANFSTKNERMRNEIVVQSPVSPQQIGDVFPIIITHNGYNGTRAAALTFGIGTRGIGSMTFSFSLGEIRMIHVASASTNMSIPLNDYVQCFRENITDLIQHNFNTHLEQEDFMNTLDFIEELAGKRKRNIIVSNMKNEFPEGSLWQMFMAITRYTSLEPNLNMRKLLENVAERVLVIPTRIEEVLTRLSTYEAT